MEFDSDFNHYVVPKTLNIDYKIVTPQTNNKCCKYVCHAKTYSDMGHLAVALKWENDKKPKNSKEYEENIRKIVFKHFEEYGASYLTKAGALLYRGRYKNKLHNIFRFYYNGDTFVRTDYN